MAESTKEIVSADITDAFASVSVAGGAFDVPETIEIPLDGAPGEVVAKLTVPGNHLTAVYDKDSRPSFYVQEGRVRQDSYGVRSNVPVGMPHFISGPETEHKPYVPKRQSLSGYQMSSPSGWMPKRQYRFG